MRLQALAGLEFTACNARPGRCRSADSASRAGRHFRSSRGHGFAGPSLALGRHKTAIRELPLSALSGLSRLAALPRVRSVSELTVKGSSRPEAVAVERSQFVEPAEDTEVRNSLCPVTEPESAYAPSGFLRTRRHQPLRRDLTNEIQGAPLK